MAFDVADIETFLAKARELGPGCLATADVWHLRYTQDVGLLLDLDYRAKYGGAIRVLHHGCEAALGLAYAALVRQDMAVFLANVAHAEGYAYALEVMTRQPPAKHLRDCLARLVREGTIADSVAAQWSANFDTTPEAPHVIYERAHPTGNGEAAV